MIADDGRATGKIGRSKYYCTPRHLMSLGDMRTSNADYPLLLALGPFFAQLGKSPIGALDASQAETCMGIPPRPLCAGYSRLVNERMLEYSHPT